MKKYLFLLLLLPVLATAGRLQNEDFKTEAELTGAGGAVSQLLNDTKIYVTGTAINKTLDDALVDGDIVVSSILSSYVDITTAQSIAGIKTFTGQLVATSTTNGSHPAPTMTAGEIVLVTGMVVGDMVYNSTDNVLNIYDGVEWAEVSGAGAGGSRLNLVEDGSFEKDVTNGTCTNCTKASEATNVLTTPNNAASLKITATAAAATYVVDETTSAQWHTGMGILKSAWIKTSASDVKIISRVDGVDETIELAVNGDGNWHQYKIPTKSGTTSNGYKISIPTDTSIVYVDETEIKPNDEIYQVAQAQFVGSLEYPTTAACVWDGGLVSSFSDFTVNNNCSSANVVGDLLNPSTKIPAFIIPNARTDGYYSVVASGFFYASNVTDNVFSLFDGTNRSGRVYVYSSSTKQVSDNIIGDFRFNSTGNKEIKVQARTNGTAAIPNKIFSDTQERTLRFSVHFYPDSQSTIVTQETTLDIPITTAWEAFTPTGSWSGNTTYSGYKRRNGENLEMRMHLSFTAQPTVGGGFSITIPDSLVIDATKLTGSNVRKHVGTYLHYDSSAASRKGIARLNDTTTLRFEWENGDTLAQLTDTSPIAIAASDSIDILVSVPIVGWENSEKKVGNIVGKFENIETSTTSNVMAHRGTAFTAFTSGAATMIYDVETRDDQNNYNPSTGVYTAHKDQSILVCPQVLWHEYVWANNSRRQMRLSSLLPSKTIEVTRHENHSTNTEYNREGRCIVVDMVKDQNFTITISHNDAGARTIIDSFSDTGYNTFSVQELPSVDALVKNMNDNKKIECETKFNTTKVTGNGTVADLTFSNLVIGKKYRITGMLGVSEDTTAVNGKEFNAQVNYNSTYVWYASLQHDFNGSTYHRDTIAVNKAFTATSSTVTVTLSSMTNTALIAGLTRTYLELCELNDNYVETTKF